jgi:PKD repeat protein
LISWAFWCLVEFVRNAAFQFDAQMKNALLHAAALVRALLGCAVIFAICGMATVVSAKTQTLRIVCYNIMDDIDGFTTPLAGLVAPFGGGSFTETSTGSVTNGGVLEGIGEEIVGTDPAQPLDILALEETTSNPITVAPIVNALNTFYSQFNPGASNMYAMSAYQATEQANIITNGNGPNAVVYNTKTVQLVASIPVDPTNGISQLGSISGEYREVMRYEFAAAGQTVTPSNVFYIYVSHYKAKTTAADQVSRTGEATIIRNDEANHLPANARVIYLGDYNISTSGEVSYQLILSNSAPNGIQQGQGVDLLNLSAATNIDWSANSLLNLKSETATALEWRFDIQIMTSNVLYGAPSGLAYVPGTYHIFGNNGSTPYESSVNSSGNSSLNSDLTPGSTITASQLYRYLTGASDHLPMVADYTIPLPDPPVASFSGSPTSGTEPLMVTFTDISTGSITNRFWDFGDSTTTNVTTNIVSHTYAAGMYGVTLIVSGPGGTGTNSQPNYISVLTAFQAWQVQYFGSTTNPAAAASADPDGDGFNNMQEFLAGTDPTNTGSSFQITNIAQTGNGVLITWMMGPGKTNALQRTAGALDGSYNTNAFSDIFIITNTVGTTTNYLDVGGATNSPSLYYRAHLVP